MSEIDVQKITKNIIDAIQTEYKKLKTLNVMILGKTGVGKSTLINNVFSEKLADTGIGKPVTRAIRKITKEDYPLAIYDTPGWELGGENSVKKLLEEIQKVIDEGVNSGDINKAIHCIWYCINTNSNRIETTEINLIREFLEKNKTINIPVIVILTQAINSDRAKALCTEIEKENLHIVKVVPVLAEDYEIGEEYIAKAYGLERLIEVMNTALPDEVRKTLIAVQCANLDLKKKRANAVVAASAATAAGIGAVPIPFSDASLLIPTQVGMLAAIAVIFGIDVDKATVMTLVTALIGTSGTTLLGKSVVSGILKLIPGAGSIVGGTISASTAATLTVALGEVYIQVFTRICQGEMSVADLVTEEGKKYVSNLFRELLKKKRGKNGQVVE